MHLLCDVGSSGTGRTEGSPPRLLYGPKVGILGVSAVAQSAGRKAESPSAALTLRALCSCPRTGKSPWLPRDCAWETLPCSGLQPVGRALSAPRPPPEGSAVVSVSLGPTSGLSGTIS